MVVAFVFLLIFLSRVLFLSISPSFFDSLEYLHLFELPSPIEALKQVHYPIHPLWITVGWLFNRIPVSTTLFKIEFLNGILGTLSCFLIYKIAELWTDKKKAILLTLICAFTPFFWMSQINVLYESLLGVFLLGSFYFVNKSHKTNETNKTNLFFSVLLFAGAFLVSPTALVYLIFLIGYLVGKKELGKLGPLRPRSEARLLGGLGVLLGFLGYLSILSLRGIPSREIFSVLSAGNSIFEKIKLEGIMFFVRGIRNSLVVYFNYLTLPVGLILGILGLLGFLGKKKERIIYLGWLISFFLLNSIWHAGMFGRLALFLTIVPLFLFLKLPAIVLKIILVFLVIVSSFRVLPYHFQKVPDVLEKEYLSGFSQKPLAIISNYEEPYLKEELADYRVINSPKTDINEIGGWMKDNFNKGRDILMTSQSITTPYFQYDGMNYQILSKRKNHPKTIGKEIFNIAEFKLIYWDRKKDVKIYQINGFLPSLANQSL